MSKAKIAEVAASQNHYQTLGVAPDADANAITKAYRKQSLAVHPDKNLEDKEASEAAFKKVSDAYQVLNDPGKKAQYDRAQQKPQASSPTQQASTGPTPTGPTATGPTGATSEGPTSTAVTTPDPTESSALVVSSGPTPQPTANASPESQSEAPSPTPSTSQEPEAGPTNATAMGPTGTTATGPTGGGYRDYCN